MWSVERPDLPAGTMRVLKIRQSRVSKASNKVEAAARSWRTFKGVHREAVLHALQQMAHGLQRCMYCEDSMGTDIDHFRPKARYPDYAFAWANFLFSCSYCNSNMKRAAFPEFANGEPVLIDPSAEDPSKHISYSPTTGLYVGVTERGRCTIDVFGLNRELCVIGRLTSWQVLSALLCRYSRSSPQRDAILSAIGNQPFYSVRMHLLAYYASDDREAFIDQPVLAALDAFPELRVPVTGGN